MPCTKLKVRLHETRILCRTTKILCRTTQLGRVINIKFVFHVKKPIMTSLHWRHWHKLMPGWTVSRSLFSKTPTSWSLSSISTRRPFRYLGSMLWSQFYAIFANFLQKLAFFLKNQCYDQIFAKTSCSLSKNANIFAIFFDENTF
jgi:hypothetical protein